MRILTRFALGMLALIGAAAPAQQPTALAPVTSPGPLAPAAAPAPASPPGAQGGKSLTADDVNAWLDGYMPYALHSGDIAGAVVVVVKDGQVLSARGFGYADVAKRTPVDPYRTLFRAGSVSKLITWTAVMQQVEAGKLDLDVDVNRYLDFKIPPYHGQPITLRQIMTHTAGFEEVAKNGFRARSKDLEPLGAYLKDWTPHRIFAPGTTPAYSNWATCLAGYIVERVSGQSFDDYVDARIFRPLGMRYASFRQPLPAAIAPYIATGYPQASVKAHGFEWVQVVPAGSLSVSGVDMARFMIAHLENGRGILRPETAALMHDSPLARVNPKSLIPPLNRMELGFFEMNANGHEVIGHLGDVENMHTSLALFIKDGIGLYLSVNSLGKAGAAHPLRVSLLQDFADRYFPSTERDGRVDAATARRHAQAMTGLWESSRRGASSWISAVYLMGQVATSVDGDGRLVIPALKDAAGATERWTEIAPYLWRAGNGHDRLAAQVVDGKVVRWSADGESPFVVFDRVPASRASNWILPLLYVSVAVLLLTLLYWPASWFVRRRYKAELGVAGNARRAYRATRVMAGLDVAVLVGWLLFVTIAGGSVTLLTNDTDGWLRLLQVASIVIIPGALGVAAWNCWLTWRDDRRWTRKLWSTLVVLAALMVLYFALLCHLISLSGHY